MRVVLVTTLLDGDEYPHGNWNTTTMISAIRMDGVIEKATLLIDGAMTGSIFATIIENMLSLTLRPGDIVVMDILSSHKSAAVEEAIDKAPADLWYLPAYSPDMNPIEKLWSKIKSCLRRIEGLLEAAKHAFRAVNPEECRNPFASCRYEI